MALCSSTHEVPSSVLYAGCSGLNGMSCCCRSQNVAAFSLLCGYNNTYFMPRRLYIVSSTHAAFIPRNYLFRHNLILTLARWWQLSRARARSYLHIYMLVVHLQRYFNFIAPRSEHEEMRWTAKFSLRVFEIIIKQCCGGGRANIDIHKVKQSIRWLPSESGNEINNTKNIHCNAPPSRLLTWPNFAN